MTHPRTHTHKPSDRNRNPSIELVLNRERRNSDMLSSLRNVKSQITDLSLVDDLTLARFGETGRQSRRPQMPFQVEHEMLCGVARAAAKSSLHIQSTFRDAVRAYFEKRCADVLSELPSETDADIVTAFLAETASQCEADPLQAAAAIRSDCPVTVERATETSRSYRRKLDAFIAASERTAANLRSRFMHRPSHLRPVS